MTIGEDRELPGGLAREEKKGYDACYAQKARPALVMMVEDLERTRCVLLRALRELIEEMSNSSAQIQIQNPP
jgi:hypothetical protein